MVHKHQISASSMMRTRWTFTITDSFVMCRESGAVNLKGLSEGMAQPPELTDCNWLQTMLSPRRSCFPCLAGTPL